MAKLSKIKSLQAYMLVSQKRKFAEVYTKMADGSWRYEALEEGVLELPCINTSLTFAELYKDVVFRDEA
jgi:hypothetical protein